MFSRTYTTSTIDHTVQMDNLLLNRLGIILNLAGSLLIAPELIGVRRLNFFERWLEERLQIIENLLRDKANDFPLFAIFKRDRTTEITKTETAFAVVFLLLLPFVVSSGIIFIIIYHLLDLPYSQLWLLLVVLYSLVLSYIRRSERPPQPMNTWHTVKEILAWAPLLPVVVPAIIISLILVGLLVGILMLPLLLARITVGLALQILSGHDALRIFVVRLGLILFVLGALLQLVATF